MFTHYIVDLWCLKPPSLICSAAIVHYNYLDPYLNGPEYAYYWNTNPHMSGALSRLGEAYHEVVEAAYR